MYIYLSNIGNVYIADKFNHRIRKVTVLTGIITTVAGTGTGTYSGDGGDATSTALYNPIGVALDVSGTMIITTICCTVITDFDHMLVYLSLPLSNY